jgi:hypothetical protein
VKRVLKGPSLDEVVLSQYGGVRKDGKVEVFDDLPLLEKSKTYLLFLTKIKDDTERNGKYQVIGGPQGLYELNGNVKKTNESVKIGCKIPNISGLKFPRKSRHTLREEVRP